VPKQVIEISEFSGGMNNYTNPDTLEENESVQLKNLHVRKGMVVPGYSEDAASGSIPDTGTLVTVPYKKTIFSYSTDYDHNKGEAFTEYLMHTDGIKLFRLENSQWVEISALETNSSSPAVNIFDGEVRFSDGSFDVTTTGTVHVPDNKTKFYTQADRNWFNDDVNYQSGTNYGAVSGVQNISSDSAIYKPLYGNITFDEQGSTVGKAQTWLGLEVFRISFNKESDHTFTSSDSINGSGDYNATGTFESVEDSYSSYLATAGIDDNNLWADSYGDDTVASDLGVSGEGTVSYETYSGQKYIVVAIDSTVEIPFTYQDDALNWEFGTGNTFEIELWGRGFRKYVDGGGGNHNVFTSFYDVGQGTASNFIDVTKIKVIPVDPVTGDQTALSTTVTWPTQDLDINKIKITFTDSTAGKPNFRKYRLRIESHTLNTERIYFHLLNAKSNLKPYTDDRFLKITKASSTYYGWQSQQDFWSASEFQSGEYVVVGRVAVPSTGTLPLKLRVYFTDVDNPGSSSAFDSGNTAYWELGPNWIAENKGKGWREVVIPLGELITREGSPALGSLDNVAFIVYTDGDTSTVAYFDDFAECEDNRGTWDGHYKFFYNWIYDRKQHSPYFEFPNQGDGLLANQHRLQFRAINRMSISGGFGVNSNSYPGGDGVTYGGFRITGANVFFAEYDLSTKTLKYDDPFQVLSVDFERGVKVAGGTELKPWYNRPADTTYFHIEHDPFELADPLYASTFSISSGYDYDPSNHILQIRFRSSAIMHRRVYYGNVDLVYEKIGDETRGIRQRYGDRVYKSLPDQPDIIPSYNYLDIGINDGDEITALAAYADRLLVFKNEAMYLVNVTQDLEFLEETYKYLGVLGDEAVTQTSTGIAWANTRGAYYYDGEEVHKISEGKINNWNLGSYPTVGYYPEKNHIIFMGGGVATGYVYDLKLESWSEFSNMTEATRNLIFYKNELVYPAVGTV
jgi:hypothetical protein|tara:strand:- start:1221 stop:4118 length:2898 start_codon:yes stop_codon:yes gene_type:complete